MKRSLPRGAFTIPEILICALLVVLLFGMVLGIYTGSMRTFFKGEDALSSTQEASMLMMHLRRDLLRFDYGSTDGFDVEYLKVTGSDNVTVRLTFDPRLGKVKKGAAAPPSDTTLSGKLIRISLPVRTDDRIDRIIYTYDPQSRYIDRENKAAKKTKRFAIPRLKEFKIDLNVQPVNSPTPMSCFTENTDSIVIQQLWFTVDMRLQSERSGGADIQRTSVDLASRIFPKRANKGLWSRWFDAKKDSL